MCTGRGTGISRGEKKGSGAWGATARKESIADGLCDSACRGFGGYIHTVRDAGEEFVGVVLIFENRIEDDGVIAEAKEFSPAAKRAVDGDLVMFDLLAGGDESDVTDGRVGGVLD